MSAAFIDRVLKLEPPKYIKAIRCVSYSEPWIQGHFPEMPVFPGVLLLESIFHLCKVLLGKEGYSEDDMAVARLDGVKFTGLVRPGDCVVLEVWKEEGDDASVQTFTATGKVEENEVIKLGKVSIKTADRS